MSIQQTLKQHSHQRSGLGDALIFHGLFFALAIPLALGVNTAQIGWTVLALAIGYNIALPLVGKWRGHSEWVALWRFLLPLSFALPCADWMLVNQGTLYFPDHGISRLGGAVPLYFCGLWIMLLWQVCWLAQFSKKPYLTVALLGLLGFLIWEWAARPMQLWEAHNVRQVAGFALYPLIPETLLSIGSLWMWRQLKNAAALTQLFGAVSLAVFYAGALSLALLWIG